MGRDRKALPHIRDPNRLIHWVFRSSADMDFNSIPTCKRHIGGQESDAMNNMIVALNEFDLQALARRSSMWSGFAPDSN